MSLGPTARDEFEVRKIDQAKSAVKGLVKNPTRTIFFLSLTGLIAGLMLGVEFSWKVYLVIGFLWGTVIYQSFDAKTKKPA